MTSAVNVRVFEGATETNGVASVIISQLTSFVAFLSYSASCYAPCTKTDLPDNRDFIVDVSYPNQATQSQIFSTGVGTTTDLDFTFSASTTGTLTVYGHWDGQEVPVTFTIDGVGGPWTTNIMLELTEGDYTVRGHYLQQTKVYTVHVTAAQNTDLIIQMDFSVYGHITVECKAAGQPVQANVIFTDSTGTILYDLTTDPILGVIIVDLLPGTYHVDAAYLGQTAATDVTIAVEGEGHLVNFAFLPVYTLLISSQSGGRATPTGDQKVLQGHTLTVLATANTGYSFGGWLLDGADIGTENPIVIVMNANHTLVARFIKTGDGGFDWRWIAAGVGAVGVGGTVAYFVWRGRKKKHAERQIPVQT